jgi:ferredoxin
MKIQDSATSTDSVHFLPADRHIALDKKCHSVLELALKNRVDIDNSCGGSGSCGTCRVKILKGAEKLGPHTDPEQAIAADRNFAKNERLACQIEPVAGLVIDVPWE